MSEAAVELVLRADVETFRRQVAIAELRLLRSDAELGPAARTALDCVQRGADPVMLLLVIEAAQEGRSLDERGRFTHESRS